MDISPVKRTKVSIQVLEQMKKLIKDNTFLPGTKLPSEEALTNMFNVSRVPVREAISALAAIGVIESKQGGGNWVRNVEVDNLFKKASIEMVNVVQVHELLEFRIIIETKAASLAAIRRSQNDIYRLEKDLHNINQDMVTNQWSVGNEADYNFHNTIVQASGNSFLIHTLDNISDLYQDLMIFSLERNIGQHNKRKEVYDEHKRIFDSIKKKDSGSASAHMRKHLENVKFKFKFK